MRQHSFKITADQQDVRLDIFLTQNLSDIPSRTFIQKLIEGGHVKVNESLVKAHYKVESGDDVFITIPDDFLTHQYVAPENIPLDVFYEDEWLLVINKPEGMLVHPAPGFYTKTLVNALLYRQMQLSDCNTALRPGIVHRLDRETSGLILVAKDNITHTKLAKQFERHTIKKCYVALVEGEVEFDEGVIEAPIGRDPIHRDKKSVEFSDGARESKTYYKVLKRNKGVTFVALMPETGRTHQLRVHMSYLGHPILGDDKYGHKKSFFRLALHAKSIGFVHPQHKCFLELSTKMPQEFLNKIA